MGADPGLADRPRRALWIAVTHGQIDELTGNSMLTLAAPTVG